MRNTIRIIILLFAITVAPACTYAQTKPVMAGAAVVDVSPDKKTGVNLAGYQPRKSDGLHDPITARCVVIDDGAAKLAIVTFDLIGLYYDDIMKAVSAASVKSGVPADNILIHSIHTHSGPDTLGLWGGSPKTYKQKLIDGAAACVEDAASHLKPAEAFFASGGVEGRNINRRHPETDNVDKTLAVMELRGPDGKSVATLVNFACHPVVLGSDNPKITADFAYYLRAKLETERGGTALFVSRDIGDANPPAINKEVYERKGGTFEMAESLGYALASDVMNLLRDARSHPIHIRMVSRQLDLPIENQQFLGLAKGGLIKRTVKEGAFQTKVAFVDFGPAQIITFPGEALTAVGAEAAKLLPGNVKFVFGLTFDEIAYIVPPAEWDGTRYEESMSVGKSTAGSLIAAYTEMKESLFGK